LGPRQWRVRGRDWTPGSRHAERLLLFLAVHPGQHRRAELASLLFSESDRTHALTYLRQALQRLREARPRLELAVDAERIGLAPSQPLWLDYAELLRAREDDPASCRRAVDLYHGAFLETERVETAPSEWWGWVCDRRREAETKLHTCFDTLLRALPSDDQAGSWILLEAWMLQQPLQDRPHYEAISFLARQSRLSEALHLYAQYEERRVIAIGRKPGPALQALRDRLQAERSLPSTSHLLPTWSPAPEPPARRRFITVLAIALDAEKEQISDRSIESHLHQCLGIAQQVGERYGGHVRVGSDGIVEIVFGLDPFPQDGPLHAVQAALLLRRWSPPGHFPRLGIHSGRTLVGAQGQLWGTLPAVARAAAWANHQRRGVMLTEAALHVLARAEPALPGSPLPPIRVHGEAIPLYWLEDLPPVTAPPSTYPLIGRQSEYERIVSAAAEVRAGGPGRILWLLGDPGLGKTHLLRHVSQDLSRQMLVVSYACQPLYRDSFLHPVAALIEQVFGLDRSQPEVARERIREQLLALGERDPLVHRLWWRWLRLEDDDPETGFLSQYRTVLFDSILDMLGSQLFPQARTLVVEDFHWADPGSFDLLRRYLTFLHEKPVLMLISSRERLPLLEGVVRHEGQISLAPWDAPTTGAFLQSLPDWHGTPEQESALYARTGGIPLYVEQLARWADVAGQPTVPESIQAILDGQIARAAGAADLLQAAAVLGTPFPLALLQRIVPWRDPETLETEAERLVERGLWQRLRDRWAFRHELLRDAVYRSLPEGSLQALHRCVAETLESLGERYPERLAHHFAAAGVPERAADYRIRAARRDLGFEQFETAEAGFAAAIAWLTPQGSSPLLAQALAGRYSIRAVRQGYAARDTRTALTALEVQCAP
ncbi:MAG: AAA family ATPase, partial [Acidithiobacillus sp.]